MDLGRKGLAAGYEKFVAMGMLVVAMFNAEGYAPCPPAHSHLTHL